MALIDDLKTVFDDYATNHCATQIVNFTLSSGAGALLNVGDTFTFKIQVTNQSHLDMKNVKVKAIGSTYADVALLLGFWSGSAVTPAFNLDAHQTYTTGVFMGKAKAVTGGAKDIVTARIDAWDASLDHLLKDHTGSGAAEGKLNKDVQPT